jgi:hypothetical protein
MICAPGITALQACRVSATAIPIVSTLGAFIMFGAVFYLHDLPLFTDARAPESGKEGESRAVRRGLTNLPKRHFSM